MDPPLTGVRASTDTCPGLIAAVFGIEADRDKRCFLYLNSHLDSVVGTAAET